MNHLAKVAIAAALAVSGGIAQAQSLSLEGGGAASLTGIVPQTYAQFTAAEGVNLQVILGQALTRSALKVAAGQLDVAVVPPDAYNAMKAGVGPYADLADQAKSMAPNLRALFGFPGGTFHAVAWADSGIDSWDDLAGKRVYIGPPAGAANRQISGMISAASGGLMPDADYEAFRAPWDAAQQSFQDGQYDVYVGSIAVGSQMLNELSLQREIVILGIPEEVMETDVWAQYVEESAMAPTVIPAGTYSGQANGDADLIAVATSMMMAVNASMDDETAYKLTKAFWDNLDAMKNANALMQSIDSSQPFANLSAALHPGAVRYYEEAGIEVPAELVPN